MVVGEVDHLADAPHLGEQAQRLLRAEVVERLHDVVGDRAGAPAVRRAGPSGRESRGVASADTNDVDGMPQTHPRGLDDVKVVGEQDRLNTVTDCG
jgi:hypothetical protein